MDSNFLRLDGVGSNLKTVLYIGAISIVSVVLFVVAVLALLFHLRILAF